MILIQKRLKKNLIPQNQLPRNSHPQLLPERHHQQGDSGDIWHKVLVNIPKHSDFEEINELLFSAEMELVDFAIKNFETLKPIKQKKIKNIVVYKKREPNDSEIKPDMSIKDQFDLLRISDPHNYPAFFKLYGHKYKIWIKKNEK